MKGCVLRRWLALCVVCTAATVTSLAGCGASDDDDPGGETSTETGGGPPDEPSPTGATSAETDDPAAAGHVAVDEAPRIPSGAAPPAGQPAPAWPSTGAPADRCEAVGDPVLALTAVHGAVDIAAGGHADTPTWLVAGFVPGEREERLVVVSGQVDGSVERVASLAVEPPQLTTRRNGPGLSDAGAFVAFSDGQRGVHLGRLRGGASLRVGAGTDARAVPRVRETEAGGALVVFSDASSGSARLMGVSVRVPETAPDTLAATDPVLLSADNAGGNNPEWVDTPSRRPDAFPLVYVDPRVNESPIMTLTLGSDGRAQGAPRALLSVSHLTDPARIAYAGSSVERGHFAYTAIGRGAHAAVGYLPAGGGAPTALVPSSGFGRLDVDGLARRTGEGAIFAADGALGEPMGSPREVRVRVVSMAGGGPQLGEPLGVRGPGGNARGGRLTRLADGRVFLAYLAGPEAAAPSATEAAPAPHETAPGRAAPVRHDVHVQELRCP